MKPIIVEQQKTDEAVNLLDRILPKALALTKSRNSAKVTFLPVIGENDTNYFLSKLKLHDMDFAGFYCNQDDKHRELIFLSLNEYYGTSNFPQDDLEKFYIKFDIANKKKNIWDYDVFEFQVLHKFCLISYNNSPISFFRKNNLANLEEIFIKTKITNYGNFNNWAKFWNKMNELNIEERYQIAGILFDYN